MKIQLKQYKICQDHGEYFIDNLRLLQTHYCHICTEAVRRRSPILLCSTTTIIFSAFWAVVCFFLWQTSNTRDETNRAGTVYNSSKYNGTLKWFYLMTTWRVCILTLCKRDKFWIWLRLGFHSISKISQHRSLRILRCLWELRYIVTSFIQGHITATRIDSG